MIIIGVSGTNGSGKDTVCHMLTERHGYLFVSGSDLLRDEARRRGWPTEREQLRTISAEWRRDGGLGTIIDKAVELYKKGDYKGLVVASIRNPGEVDRIHELGGKLIWVDADTKVRYDRIFSRQRADDNKTYEQFLAEEQAEMQQSGDEATLNMSAVKKRADIIMTNEGHDIEAFKDQAEQSLCL